MQTIDSEKQLRTRLTKHGMRLSEAKKAVFDILHQTTEPLTVQQIVKRAPQTHYVSIYRAVDTLVRIDVIKAVPLGLKYAYELSDDFKPHHHHILCEQCGDSMVVEDEHIEHLVQRLASQYHIKPTRHTFEMYGLCRKCQKTRQPQYDHKPAEGRHYSQSRSRRVHTDRDYRAP
jgi:Fe2+ or Zn2+ uptake regulation protein